jgi:predicted nucleotidyltransferase
MDYLSPIEAVIPGAQGRVLRVLANTERELTMRSVASLAGVSVAQTAKVLRRLTVLGIVERQNQGSSALVKLVRENEASQALLRLNGLHHTVMSRLKQDAGDITPMPASLVVFGSFARGEARVGSDIDVLEVDPPDLSPEAEQRLELGLATWSKAAHCRAGNPVNLLRMSLDDFHHFKESSESLWRSVERDGIVLVGCDPGLLVGAPA